MTSTSWKQFEDYVRAIATLRFGAPCRPEHVAGVDVDGVIHASSDELILVEITENCTLEKVRGDILKISNVRVAQLQSGMSCKAFIVVDGEPTHSMVELGSASKVNVLSSQQFENTFFNYQSYVQFRENLPFGSAVDSTTGQNDSRRYVGTEFPEKGGNKTYNVKSICDELSAGNKIIVTGDYGTGKSRLVREVFERMKLSIRDSSAYIIAINLREHWGSNNFLEILGGHLQSIGLSTSTDNAVRLLRSGHLILLLDGFDEIGSQSHDIRVVDRISLRKQALQGVRDLIQQTQAGVLITGRSHYFDDDKEIFDALGISSSARNGRLIEAPPSFTKDQAKIYLADLGLNVDPPEWLPKKPLVFQIAAELDRKDLEKVLQSDTGPFEFWGVFLGAVTRRESKGVQGSISADTIRSILIELGGISRQSLSPLGRFTQSDINQAYSIAIGTLPDAVGQQLLARMCTLGRIEPQSPDRQFLDVNIADILRAEHLVAQISSLDARSTIAQWKQPLMTIGVFHAASAVERYDMVSLCFTFLNKFSTSANRYLLGEIISLLSAISNEAIDFKALSLSHGCIPFLYVAKNQIKNLEVSSCEISMLILDIQMSATTENFTIKDSIISLVSGISNSSALPAWIVNCEVMSYEDGVSNSASIKASSLPDGQKLLLSIVHKIFFQPGSGREEAALLKGGYGLKFDKRTLDEILKRMHSDGLIEKFKGDDGLVYKPVRRHTERMAKLKSELTLSDDPLWLWAGTIK